MSFQSYPYERFDSHRYQSTKPMEKQPSLLELAENLRETARVLQEFKWWQRPPFDSGKKFIQARSDLGDAIRKISQWLEWCEKDASLVIVIKWLLSDAEAVYHNYGGK